MNSFTEYQHIKIMDTIIDNALKIPYKSMT